NVNVKLTEKEIDIILFLNENKVAKKISTLQNKVWGYNVELETHTVETHIYRLRKKINYNFKDDNFIISTDEGYLLK
ncbi:helix-turn-helix domain-containing protein, partial [Candidatus Pelagibacter sp.]|nr:helix-turn-helix domain-containing protein [Candidatus Pelagibacter sp.]